MRRSLPTCGRSSNEQSRRADGGAANGRRNERSPTDADLDLHVKIDTSLLRGFQDLWVVMMSRCG